MSTQTALFDVDRDQLRRMDAALERMKKRGYGPGNEHYDNLARKRSLAAAGIGQSSKQSIAEYIGAVGAVMGGCARLTDGRRSYYLKPSKARDLGKESAGRYDEMDL